MPGELPKVAPQVAAKARKHVETALVFVSDLCKIFSSNPSDVPATDELVDQISEHVKKLHMCHQKYIHGIAGDPEVNEQGTRLWNICARLRRECEPTAERLKRLFLHGRVLAFHLLVIAKPKEKCKAHNMIHVVKLALKATRNCIDSSEPALATALLQTAADYKAQLQNIASSLPSDEMNEYNCLEVEYFTVRTALSWIENRLDVAEHMYIKGERLQKFLTPAYAEKLADVLYEIGKSLSVRSDYTMAIKWLERANTIINAQSLENLSREGIELRLAVLQALVTALLGSDTTEGLEQANKYVDYIESQVGNKLVVLLLRLELLQKTPAEVFDGDAYADIIRLMMKSFNSSDSGFKLILHHIRKLHDKCPGIGCTILDEFILSLGVSEINDWVEKAIVTRLYVITGNHQRDSVEVIDAVYDMFSRLAGPLSALAAVASQALIWRKSEANFRQGQYELAERWCRLSLHTLFQNGGPVNTSKIERKLLLCALGRNNLESATLMIQSMSKQSCEDPMTAYLAFKVAIRVEDRALAERCLEAVSLSPDHIDYLGACIAESQKVGDIACAIAALKKLQEKYEYKEPNAINLPALFRCTIRLLNLLVEKSGTDKSELVNDLCQQFDAVVLALERQQQEDEGSMLLNVDELEWFSRNAYNLALKHSSTWDLRYVVRMLTACVSIIDHFPSDLGSTVEQSLKTLFSRFIIASALVSLARTQDNVQKQLRDYLEMRTHIKAFDNQLPEYLLHLDEQSRNDMIRKHAMLLAFDFEAAVALGQWEDLGGIVQRAVSCRNVVAYQSMADSLLRAQAPGQVLYSTMRKIVNEIWVLETFDAVKLAKYTRCLFQATLPLDDGLTMSLLDEACNKARELRENEGSWPEEELEWMATTAFNHSIDCYGAHESERAKEWATKAMNLAHYCSDGGGLERALQGRYMSLNLDHERPN
ncbi:meiosis protein SPO22/ZIP4 like-domain-containing protein [Bombardia bombarda]|uniref:Meiosis protein SPO22/ZIP4 like-domain-containing protein n=1 Tax=Bombardia bombarda TaxID=252184 RepID=A0AA39XIE1_9PEZI|nr:meiosis protein SPO22/ZIP4 like-domain-containing protein [Bombardia bombarda]